MKNGPMSFARLLYALAIFLSSFLLFLVEPIAGKRLLPLLGGSAAVWTTCLVFFQVALLLGYLSAHWLATRLSRRTQAPAYVALLAICLVQAFWNLRRELHGSTDHPILSVFWLLGTFIGLPFVALSATNPLLQTWYSQAAGMRPPYRLFALSNLASILALLLYPWMIEPRFSLHAQSLIWLAGFVCFVLACAVIAALKAARRDAAEDSVATTEPSGEVEKQPSQSDRALWLLLAACGSLLLCAMTNHITQNVAGVPLLWILPLAMYLLSFVIAFSRGRWLPALLRAPVPGLKLSLARMCLMGFAAVALGAVVFMISDPRQDLPLIISLPFYSGALFVLCLFCHAELQRLQPAPRYATSFYLIVAGGGALGSMFVGIAAPIVFSGSFELPCGLVLTSLLILAVTWRLGVGWRIFWAVASVGIAGTLIHAQLFEGSEHVLLRLRNFYGVLRVTQKLAPPLSGPTRTLYNGTITHGTQVLTAELHDSPTTYFGHNSGVGLALDLCCSGRPRRVGVIGLGVATLAAYRHKDDVFRFYEINPLVERIARNAFFYIRDSTARIEIVSGDARLSMAGESPQQYDILVIDAFSGDAIPVHLLTSQAIELYRRHLKPEGIMAFHVSNKFLNLAPVVEQEAAHAGFSIAYVDSPAEEDIGVFSSDWVLVSTNHQFLSNGRVLQAASAVHPVPGLRLWTDDYNSVLPLLKWGN